MPAKRNAPRPVNKEFIRVTKAPRGNTWKYEPTKAALKEAHAHARRGGTVSELARLFRLDPTALNKWVSDPDNPRYRPEFAAEWHRGQYEFLSDLREKQIALAETNGAVSIHLGKHNLEQHDRPQEVNHLHRVIGTMPDYDATSEAWRKQFAPPPVLDGGKLIEQEIEDADVVEDDEVE